MVSMQVSCIIHHINICTLSRVNPIHELTTDAMNTASDIYV